MAIIILTGAPGVGKTTVVSDVAQKLDERGVRVGGIVSREVRTNNVRTGFEFIDVATDDRNILALLLEMGQRLENIMLACQDAD